jgi:hypothetical protein
MARKILEEGQYNYDAIKNGLKPKGGENANAIYGNNLNNIIWGSGYTDFIYGNNGDDSIKNCLCLNLSISRFIFAIL